MAIRVALKHRTEYHYDRSVGLGPHLIRLRPAPHVRTPIHHYSMHIEPGEHFLNWQQDAFGNYVARLVFPEKADKLIVDVNLVAELVTINPFDFFVEEYAQYFPFKYSKQDTKELTPYFETTESGPLLSEVLADIHADMPGLAATLASVKEDDETPTGPQIVYFLVELNARVQKMVGYTIRMEPGIQSCEETLQCTTGSCRDSAWLLVQILRHMGLAARFVSGYLVQLTADQKALDGPSGPEADFTDLHAWTEVFIPGAGWVGLDPTSGLFAGEGHIPLACTPDPVSAAPIVGATDKCEVEFVFDNSVTRIHEDPRVTKPYTDDQWAAILALGDQVDEQLAAGDVRLTMGGEPTFVSIDDMDSPQWNTAALGAHKLDRAGVLLRRLQKVFAAGGVLHYGQGKWYPGEQLPRWALTCAWRKDGAPIWTHPELLDHPEDAHRYKIGDAQRLAQRLTAHLGLSAEYLREGFEDVAYYLWKEGTLPPNVNVIDNRLREPLERERLRRLFERGLDEVTGYTLPIAWDHGKQAWISSDWQFRREHMFLIPGDSPMGYRLPLDSLLWEPEDERQQVVPRDPFDIDRNAPPEIRDRLRMVRGASAMAEPKAQSLTAPADAQERLPGALVRTALCIEPRKGHLYVFLPPLYQLDHYLDLINAIEAAAVDTGLPVIMEGYEPPRDPRLERLLVTPDPGVIEVNIHPATTWRELVGNTETLYEEARQSRLGTEKFMLDGRHTGTGGGNHVTIGAATPADSPMLRRPHLLRSLLTYWQHHPGLSYLFSGMFVGPTSQAPRVDEARDDAIYELGIAFGQMPDFVVGGGDVQQPWMVDRLLRNLLVDVSGNTHRSEFCIDKLYSPDGPTGRLGLVEFRGFEMPPHARMASVQTLLLRSLIGRFWDKPYDREPIRWGTELHDRFMLPHYVEADVMDVIHDLDRHGYGFDPSWIDPFVEFRFPRFGTVNVGDIEVELRFGIEPWNVLGEEVTALGTARYVDSSVERLQVKATGLVEGRHVVTCNGRAVPLRNTGTRGEFVAGVRYKAWNPPSSLHPTINPHAPLVFDVIDTWNERSLGGCTYHVAHPGGRSYDTFPVNANEAEARRLARFDGMTRDKGTYGGHSGGRITIPGEERNPDFPWTLDLRTRPRAGKS
ncbi:MAG: transglutaminase family protein [Gammaproteobacteria bacterium]|nr:transglutaminase family protein [Gammaproteobacteria bacterium]MCP5137875.1 transglutaminase family protein [Gammaproteobacteria bacterium]